MSLLKPTQSSKAGFGCLLAFTVLWNSFVGLFVATLLRDDGANPFALLFMLPFVAVGLALIGGCGWMVVSGVGRGLNLAPPEITVSKSTLRVGESFQFAYRQAFKRDVDVHGVTIQLFQRETAVFQRGTDTKTVTHDKIAHEFTHLGQTYGSTHAFYDSRELRIPADGMHTFIANRNKIQWFVKIELRMAGWPDISETYELTVVPERMVDDGRSNY